MTIFDYLITVVGVFLAVLGVVQLITKKPYLIKKYGYTDESLRKFALISGAFYTFAGIVMALFKPLIVCFKAQLPFLENISSLNNWFILAVLIIMLIIQMSVLKQKK